MPRSGSRLAAPLAALVILVASLPAGAAELDRGAFRWTDEFGTGDFREGQVAPGRLVVQFAEGAGPAEAMALPDGSMQTGNPGLDQVAAQIGARSIGRLFPPLTGARRALESSELASFYVVQFDADRSSVLAAAEALARLPGVVGVEPDPVVRMHGALPNDPGLDSQWWLRNMAVGGGDVRAVGAWNFTTGDPDVLVCVADSGVDWQHPDLGGTGPDYTDGVIFINEAEYNGTPGIDDDGNGKIDDFRGWDFVENIPPSQTLQTPPQDITTPDNDPMDYGGHGTNVSGCIAAITNNGIGIASINWNAKILPARIGVTTDENQGVVYMTFAAQAFNYARIMGADVFNCSWGSVATTNLVIAVNNAIAAGMIIVESAGNSNNQTASYLGSRGDIISVAALNSGDTKTGFSSYGTWVDIAAPGIGIFTTSFDRQAAGAARHVYTSVQGTSFSSPIVAGGFAMAKAYYPSDTRQQLIDRVLAAVDDISAANPSLYTQLGSGRLNLTKLFYDGSFWPVPGMMPELLDAMQVASVSDTIAVESGHLIPGPLNFTGSFTGIIQGGWDPTYTSRDPMGNPSIIASPLGQGTALRVSTGVGPELVIDGFQISDSHPTNPILAPTEAFYGGGVLVYESSPTLKNLTVTGNRAGDTGETGFGGGMAIISGSPVLENIHFENNQALSGAALYVWDSTPTMTQISADGNTSWAPTGGGNPLGGAVYVKNSPPGGPRRTGGILVSGGTFANNTTAGQGGALFFENSNVELEDLVVENNGSVKDGAGIAASASTLSVRRTSLLNNDITPSASLYQGGGLYASNSSVTLDSLEVRDNYSTFGGGGLAIASPTSLSLTNSLVAKNSAAYFGGGIYVSAGAPGMIFTGNTVAENFGGSLGGNGIYVNGGDADYQLNVVAFNTDGSTSPNGINLSASTGTFSCNLVHGNTLGNYGGTTDPTGSNGNIDSDPMFCDAAAGNYHLDAASPAAQAVCGFMGAREVGCNMGTGIADEGTPGAARRLALSQNRPNPFNPSTLIEFSLPAAGRVQLRVYDMRGRLVRQLADRHYEAGSWTVSWDGRDDAGRTVASGTYLYELRADERRLVRKMGLLK